MPEPQPEPEPAAAQVYLDQRVPLHPWAAAWDQADEKARGRMLEKVRTTQPLQAEQRAAIWFSVMRVGEKRRRSEERGRSYEEYRRRAERLPPLVVGQIRQDLPRTMPERAEFGEEGAGPLTPALERVLLALSARNSVVGYCQGMNFVVAALLLATRDEQSAFWLACAFAEDLVPPNFHGEGLCGAEVEWHVFDELMRTHADARAPTPADAHPKTLSEHFEEVGVPLHVFATSWFITFFASSWPLDATYIVWDRMLCEAGAALHHAAVLRERGSRPKPGGLRHDVVSPTKHGAAGCAKEL